MKPKISVIVAVYKAETYLSRCLDSILAQAFTDWEAILVDDGSPDRSGEICDEYASRDPRFKVIHKENGGVASARQAGIDHASGEYSIHCDPDDWTEPIWLSVLYDKALEDDADMVISDFYKETHDKPSQYLCQKPKDNAVSSVLSQLVGGRLCGPLWSCLIKTSLYSVHDIKFPLNLSCCEDIYVVTAMLIHSGRITYVPKALYHYDVSINTNSLSGKSDPRPTKRVVDSLMFYTDYVVENLTQPEYADAVNWRVINTKSLMWASGSYSKREFLERYRFINKIITRKYRNGQLQQSRTLALAVLGGGGYMLAKLIEMTRPFRPHRQKYPK